MIRTMALVEQLDAVFDGEQEWSDPDPRRPVRAVGRQIADHRRRFDRPETPHPEPFAGRHPRRRHRPADRTPPRLVDAGVVRSIDDHRVGYVTDRGELRLADRGRGLGRALERIDGPRVVAGGPARRSG